MARNELGEDFDVHGGGLDLIFPHHENERAQSEAAGERFARVWMHNGMLRLTGEKMSKSLGNIEGLADALERVGRETLLVFFAQAHYRSPVDYTGRTLEQAAPAVAWRRCATRAAMRRRDQAGRRRSTRAEAFGRFRRSWPTISTRRAPWPSCTAWRMPSTGRRERSGRCASRLDAADQLVRALDVLGLASLDRATEAPTEALALAEERSAARTAGDYARADELRDRIAELGFGVRDTPQGPQVVPLDD
jgi:cysteinyl-tRNA synthetase